MRTGGNFLSSTIYGSVSLSVSLYLYPGILPGIERSAVGQYDQYLISLQEATRISVTSLFNPDTTSVEIEAITEQYLHHDEDIPDRHAEPSIISMSRHVSECINAGLTSSIQLYPGLLRLIFPIL